MAYFPGSGSGGNMTLISDQPVTTAQASITFSSIPQTYKHLYLNITARDTSANTTGFYVAGRINGVSTSSYYSYGEFANSTGAGSTGGQASGLITFGYMGIYPGGSAAASNVFGRSNIWFPSYTSSSKNPTWTGHSWLTTSFATGGQQVIQVGGMYTAAGAITQLSFTPNAGNWAVNSRFTLYGVS